MDVSHAFFVSAWLATGTIGLVAGMVGVALAKRRLQIIAPLVVRPPAPAADDVLAA